MRGQGWATAIQKHLRYGGKVVGLCGGYQMLGRSDSEATSLMRRIKIISPAKRPVPGPFFERVAEALLERRQLHMRYHTRARREDSERDVSPQRLVHYRSTWYLDAWCHQREKLLRFALDAVRDSEATGVSELLISCINTRSNFSQAFWASSCSSLSTGIRAMTCTLSPCKMI